MQPHLLTEKDSSRLCQLVLYHHSPEVVANAFLVLANGLQSCSSFQLNLSKFVPSYLTTLGAIKAGLEADTGSSLVADLFRSLPTGNRQGTPTYYIDYGNFSNFMDLVLLELELRPLACPPQLLSQLCRWCLLMLMDDQMLVFALSLEKLFLNCFEMLSAQNPSLADTLLEGVVSNVSSHSPEHTKLALLAQALLLDNFPVMSQIPKTNQLLQNYRARLALVFLEQSFNPLLPLTKPTVKCLCSQLMPSAVFI